MTALVMGKMPFRFGYSLEMVGIEDAARTMLLAAEQGRDGERYIISERYLSSRELHAVAFFKARQA